MIRAIDVIDVQAEPTSFLPLDPTRHTLALLEHSFAMQLRRQDCPADAVEAASRRAALELYAQGWRSSQSILHQADNPIPAPAPPRLPPVLSIAA
jgi:hypothetical protein